MKPKDEDRMREEGEKSSAIEQIAMLLDGFDGGGMRPGWRADMKAIMTLPELHEVEQKLKLTSALQDANTVVNHGITAAKHARKAEADRPFENYPPARVEVTF